MIRVSSLSSTEDLLKFIEDLLSNYKDALGRNFDIAVHIVRSVIIELFREIAGKEIEIRIKNISERGRS